MEAAAVSVGLPPSYLWKDATPYKTPGSLPSVPRRPPLYWTPRGVFGGRRRPHQPLPEGCDGVPWWRDVDPSLWFDPRFSHNHRWGNDSGSSRDSQNGVISRETLASDRNGLGYGMGRPMTVGRKGLRSPEMPRRRLLLRQTTRLPADLPGGQIGLMSLFVSALTIFIMILSVFGVTARSPADLTSVLSGLADQALLSHSVQNHIANAVALFGGQNSKEDKIRSKRSPSTLQHVRMESMGNRMSRQYDPLSQIAISAAMVLGAYAGYSIINRSDQGKKGNVRRNPQVKDEVQRLVLEDVPGDSEVSESEVAGLEWMFTTTDSSAEQSHLTENSRPVKLQLVPTTHPDGSLQVTEVTSHQTPPHSGHLSRFGQPALSTTAGYFTGLLQDNTQTKEPVINLWGADASQEERINFDAMASAGGSASLLPVRDLRPHLVPITHSDSEFREPPDLYSLVMMESVLPSEQSSVESSYSTLEPGTPPAAVEVDSVQRERWPSYPPFEPPATPSLPGVFEPEVQETLEPPGVRLGPKTPDLSQSANQETLFMVESPEVNFRPLESHHPNIQKFQAHGSIGDSGVHPKPSAHRPNLYEAANPEIDKAGGLPHTNVKHTSSYQQGGGQLTPEPHSTDGHHPLAPLRVSGTSESSPWSKYHNEGDASDHGSEVDHMVDERPGILIKITIPAQIATGSDVYSSADKYSTQIFQVDAERRPERRVPVQYTPSKPSDAPQHPIKSSSAQTSHLSTETSIPDHFWQRVPLISAEHYDGLDPLSVKQDSQEESVFPDPIRTPFVSSEVQHRFPGQQPYPTKLTNGRPQDLNPPYNPSDYDKDTGLASGVKLDEQTFTTLLKLAKQELESLKTQDGNVARAPSHQTREGHVKGYAYSTEVLTNVRQDMEEKVDIDDYIIRPSLYVNGRRVDNDIPSPEGGLRHREEITFPSELLHSTAVSDLDHFLKALLTKLNSTSSFKGMIIPDHILNVTQGIPNISRDDHDRSEDLELGLLLEIVSKENPGLHGYQTTADAPSTEDAKSVNTHYNDGSRETLHKSKSNHYSGHDQSSTLGLESSSETKRHVSSQRYAIPASAGGLHAINDNQQERKTSGEGLWTASQLSTWSSVSEDQGTPTSVTRGATFLPTQGYGWRDGDILMSLLRSSDLPRRETSSPSSFHRTESSTKINHKSEASSWAAKAIRRPTRQSDYMRHSVYRTPQTYNRHHRLTFPSDKRMNAKIRFTSEIPKVLPISTNSRHMPPYLPHTSPEILSENSLNSAYPPERSLKPWDSSRSAKIRPTDEGIRETETSTVIPLASRSVVTNRLQTQTTTEMARKQLIPTLGVDLGVTRRLKPPYTALDGSQDQPLLLPTGPLQKSQHEPSVQSISSDTPPYQIPQYRDSSESAHFPDSQDSQAFQYSASSASLSVQHRPSPPIHLLEYSLNNPINPPPSFIPAKDSKQSVSIYKTPSRASSEPLRSYDLSKRDVIRSTSPSTASSKEYKALSSPTTQISFPYISRSPAKYRGSHNVGLMSRFLCRHTTHHDACAVCMEEVGHRPECLIRRP